MERVSALIQGLRPSPPRSFSYTTRGSKSPNAVRRRASAGDLFDRSAQRPPYDPNGRMGSQQPHHEQRQEQRQEQTGKIGKRKTSGFSFRHLFRWRPSTPPPDELPKDPLPHDSSKLDGLVNYHLGQIERIKRELKHFNRTIDQLTLTYMNMAENGEMPGTTYYLDERIKVAVNSRNLLSRFVAFHLQELERILILKLELGQGRPVPNLFVNLPTDAEWNELFR
ncbi:hypothetical protein VTO42DRAFT_1451 [Malbranchea cinnamomea]